MNLMGKTQRHAKSRDASQVTWQTGHVAGRSRRGAVGPAAAAAGKERFVDDVENVWQAIERFAAHRATLCTVPCRARFGVHNSEASTG